ncbi:MAG: hypothetical protein WKG07_35595 [Hymenobacter sp.]
MGPGGGGGVAAAGRGGAAGVFAHALPRLARLVPAPHARLISRRAGPATSSRPPLKRAATCWPGWHWSRWGVGAYGWRGQPRRAAGPSALAAPAPPRRLALAGGAAGASGGPLGLGATQVPPAYDEVFSAVYCAGSGSLLTTWSYYMLPNNHVLFNLLNGGLFGWLHQSTWLVPTGRLLSGLAYAGTLAVIYRLVAGLTGQRGVGAVLAVLAGLQYSLWGFGFQARGYALYALLHWVALGTLLAYWRQPRQPKWLVINMLAVAAGYAVVPTFLFYHAAQLLAGGGAGPAAAF